MRSALMDCVSVEDFKAVAMHLLDLAKTGDSRDVQIFMDRIIGKAVESVEVSGPGGEVLTVRFKREDKHGP